MPVDTIEAAINASIESAVGEPEPAAEPVDTDAASTETEYDVADEKAGEEPAPKPGEATEPVAKPADKTKDEPVDEFAKEHDLKAKTADGRENRIPYSRVRKITDNAVTKAKTTWETAELEPVKQKLTQLESHLSEIGKVEHIMFEEPAKFVEILKTIPGYATLLAAPVEAKPTTDTQRPGPDIKNADGTVGYSTEGLQKLLDYTAAQARDAAVKEAEDRFTKRFGPIEKQHTERQRQEALHAQLVPQIQAEMKEAEEWPLFKENADAILKELQANPDPRFTLAHAWRKVVVPKLTTDRAKMREELLAELEKAPRSTATPSGAAPGRAARAAGDPNVAQPLEDVINQAIAAAGLK